MSKIQEVKTNVETGKSKLIADSVKTALDAGESASDILQSMIDAMSVIGDKFSKGEIFVPEMLIAAKSMAKGVEVLKPELAGNEAISRGKCVIGTVAGDLHDIGKNLVSLMIESAGFEVIDLGVDVPPAKFVEAAKAHSDVKIIAASGLLTTTMSALKETVETVKKSGLNVKMIIGGAPVTSKMAEEFGADAYAPDAGSAAEKVKQMTA